MATNVEILKHGISDIRRKYLGYEKQLIGSNKELFIAYVKEEADFLRNYLTQEQKDYLAETQLGHTYDILWDKFSIDVYELPINHISLIRDDYNNILWTEGIKDKNSIYTAIDILERYWQTKTGLDNVMKVKQYIKGSTEELNLEI